MAITDNPPEDLPPILEVEDQLSFVIREPSQLLDPLDPHPLAPSSILSPQPTEENTGWDDERKEGENKVRSQRVATLGPDGPSRAIDDHTQFWSTYDRVADAYDKELLDAWNKSLDVLLIFAGLFSAINTAFIMESYRGLQPDPAETTNALLRLFITHRSDNATLLLEDLIPSAPSAVPINSIFFSSLSFSLTAAFGAVTAKQWLTEYANVGGVKSLHIQGKRRQEKYNGLRTWQLQLIIELLPMLLQISLLLFLVGVIQFLWTLDRTVAVGQLVLSAAGLAVYMVTIIIGIVVPTSPFQTPLSRYLPKALDRLLKSLIPNSTSRLRDHGTWIPLVIPFLEKHGVTAAVTLLLSNFGPHLSVFIHKIGISYSHCISIVAGKQLNLAQWDNAEINAAESVVWLLEQAEHPDVTIIALDAVPRLPPDLLLTLIKEREGLLQRLIRFHNNLLPPRLSSNGGMESRLNTAVVSGLALHHILKSQRPKHILYGAEALPLQSLNAFDFSDVRDLRYAEDSVVFAKGFINLHLSSAYHSPYDQMSTLSYLIGEMSLLLGHWSQIEVELSDARRGLTGSSFITSVFPFELVLDFIIRLAWEKPSFAQDSDSLLQTNWFISESDYYGRCLRRIMLCLWWSLRENEEPSRNALSHLAIATTAIFWSQKCANPWSYPSRAHEMQFEQLLISRCLAVDKSDVALENIALALSMIDAFEPDAFGSIDFDPDLFDPLFFADSKFSMGPHIFHRLFKVASPLINAEIILSGMEIPHPNFAQSLLRLSRQIPQQDRETYIDIIRALVHCPDGDWMLPTGQTYSNDIIRLLELLLYTDFEGNPVSSLLDKMAEFMSDLQLISAMSFIYPHHRSIANLEWPPNRFMGKVLMLHEHNSSRPSILLETQMGFAVAMIRYSPTMLSRGTPYEVCAFLNRIVQLDSELQWPMYFITAGIVPPDTQRNAEPPVLLKSIDHDHLSSLFRNWWDRYAGDATYAWTGEALLLLWKKGRRECVKGGLPQDWNDSVFFEPSIVEKMGEYFLCIRLRGYTEIDWDLMKEYFGRALDTINHENINFGTTERILEELNDYSNDYPPPPREITITDKIMLGEIKPVFA